jgi:hypothetical protein
VRFRFQRVERRVAIVEQHRLETRRKRGNVKKLEDLRVSWIHQAHSCRVPQRKYSGSILIPFSRRTAPCSAASEPAAEVHAAHASVATCVMVGNQLKQAQYGVRSHHPGRIETRPNNDGEVRGLDR